MQTESVMEALYELNVELALLALPLWFAAAVGAGRLALRRSAGTIRRRSRLGLILLAAGLITVVARAYAAAALSAHGWSLGADFITVALPPLVLPAVAVAALVTPRYWRIARSPVTAADLRRDAASPALVVPVQATAAGALLSLVWTLSPPVEPYLPRAAVTLVVLGLVTVVLTLWRRRQARQIAAPGFTGIPLPRRLLEGAAKAGVVLLVLGVWTAQAYAASRLPGRIGMTAHEHTAAQALSPHGVHDVPVDRLTGPAGEPAQRITLTARHRTMRLASGETVDAYAFNDSIPGPTLRIRAGSLVEVTLVNVDVAAGVTVHWHGVHVANAEDGVAGVTQDAVAPGRSHVYRLRTDQVGTFWYHSHQQSATQVFRGLFGALVIEPPAGPPADVVDTAVVAHAWDVGGRARTALGDTTGVRREQVPAGRTVRMRLVNADNCPRTFALTGTAYRVVAIDGVDVHGPTDLTGTQVRVAGGGRYDLEYVQPATTVQLSVTGDANGLPSPFGFSEGCGEDNQYGGAQQGRDRRTDRQARDSLAVLTGPAPDGAPVPVSPATGVLDPLGYGTPAPTPFGAGSRFDRDYELRLGLSFGFYDGHFTGKWTVNNASFPDVPAQVVSEGDLVKLTFANRSLDDHPMHPHGHTMLVLSRNGVAASGSPWWTDTLNVAPGEVYEVALRADNPGIWMDHCHNLEHTQVGMMMHLVYTGVSSPYEMGRGTPNQPE
ncbi:multicopper oxidase family protein [Actinoplanes sp. NPDC049316]|uniref:multicopper oxidase family protein n=1 Tax=Actinoplanes sp. NPDC049316 TaxID=3154727 RepID=UPI003420B91A